MITFTKVLSLLVAVVVASAGAFVPSTVLSSKAKQQQLRRPPLSRSSALALSSSSSLLSSEIFLLSFDGTVAQTTEYRITVGIDLAFAAWPHLKDLGVIASAEADPNGTDSNNQHEWLRNKMRALSHVLVARPDVSLTCDYALLARLLMEEQELDGFRSNGSRGKYGSKFHPQTSSSSSKSASESTRQTRPLTVGEIASNWNKGGCIGETVLTKYHVNYKNPLPMLQEKVEELMAEKEYDIPEIHEAVMDVLQHSNGNIIITLGHPSDLPLVKKTLLAAKNNMEPYAMLVGDNSFFCCDDVDESGANVHTVKLVPISSTNAAIYEDVLKQAPSCSTVYVFESSWHALEESISLFGDNIPRGTGMAKTILGRDVQLSLNFPAWASPAGSSQSGSSSDSDSLPDGVAGLGQAKQQNEALMNVWTNLVSEDEMSELLSARIVGSS